MLLPKNSDRQNHGGKDRFVAAGNTGKHDLGRWRKGLFSDYKFQSSSKSQIFNLYLSIWDEPFKSRPILGGFRFKCTSAAASHVAAAAGHFVGL